MNLNFQTANKSDLPLIVKVYNQSIPSRKSTADLKLVSVKSKVNWFKSHNSRYPIWMISNRLQKIGWVSLSPFYGRPAYHATTEISIYVEKHCQHRGVGGQTLKFIGREAAKLNFHTILAFVFSENAASQAMFKSAGYQQYGHLPSIADMKNQILSLDVLGKKI